MEQNNATRLLRNTGRIRATHPKTTSETRLPPAGAPVSPDVSNAADAEDRFKEINEAYQVLSDDDKRAAYDRFGHAGCQGGMPGGRRVQRRIPRIRGDLRGVLRRFGGLVALADRRRRRGPAPGRDLRYDLTHRASSRRSSGRKSMSTSSGWKAAMCARAAAPNRAPAAHAAPTATAPARCGRSGRRFLGSMVNVTDCPRCHGTWRSGRYALRCSAAGAASLPQSRAR